MKGKYTEEFEARLRKHYDELKWLYYELYHSDEQAFEYFCGMLNQYYEDRPAYLKESDRYRESHPDWYRGNDMLGMQMYAGPFAGTLKGIRGHLDYISECGGAQRRRICRGGLPEGAAGAGKHGGSGGPGKGMP